MNTTETLRAAQAARVAELGMDLQQYLDDGNEYYAALVRDEIIVAQSLARLVHKADKPS